MTAETRPSVWTQAIPTVEDRYAEQHCQAMAKLIKLRETLENLPAPDNGAINWGHVGSLTELNLQLEQALEFIQSI